MTEVSAPEAAEIVGVSRITIWKDVRDGRLPAQTVHRRRYLRISLDDLRRYAKENNRRFSEEKASRFN